MTRINFGSKRNIYIYAFLFLAFLCPLVASYFMVEIELSPKINLFAGVQVSLNRAKKPLPGTSQQSERTTNVHFVLLRSVTRSAIYLFSSPTTLTLVYSLISEILSDH